MKNLVLFASGSGSNVENIANYFKDDPEVAIRCVLSNKRNAPVFDRCDRLGISAFYFNRTAFYHADSVLELIKAMDPDLIVLAGFLWKIPINLLEHYPHKIINIHPALLPKFGGKGMYGLKVHEAVKAAGETETGMTVHYVNADYDEGAVIFQARTSIDEQDSAQDIAGKVHQLEYEHYPKTIQRILSAQ